MIKYYETEAAYAADAKSPFESQVSLVGESNGIHYDGRNVIVGAKHAKTGAIVVLDGNSAMHFVALDTFSSSSFMSNYTVVGVVAVGVDHPDFRGKLVIVHKENASKKWSAIYSFKLTGYTLDGTDRTGILSIRTADAWGTAKDFTVSYNASTAADLLDQLNAYFSADTQYTPAGGTAMDNPFKTQNWVASKDDNDNITLTFLFTDSRQASNAGKTGFALTANLLPGIASSSSMLRYNGERSGEGSLSNWDRAITYFKDDLSSSTYNPTSNVTSPKMGYPICKPAYLGVSAHRKDGDTQLDYCSALRAIYGEGEEGWLKFMASFWPVRPTNYGPMGDKATYGDGKKNTYLMAGIKFTKQDNTEIAAFPAADYCASVVYNHELLKKGAWQLPDVDTLCAVLKTIKYNTTNNRNADPVNRALNAIGGNAISNGSSSWSSSRYLANVAWCSYGASGFLSVSSMFVSVQAVPVALLDVSEANI